MTQYNKVKPHLLNSFANIDLGPGVNVHMFAISCFCASVTLSADAEGYGEVPSKLQLNQLGKNRALAIQMNDILLAANGVWDALASKKQVTDDETNIVVKEMGELAARLWAHNGKAKGSHLGQFRSFIEIGNHFWTELQRKMVVPMDIICPRALTSNKKQPAAKPTQVQMASSMDQTGSATDWFKTRGIDVGVQVVSKQYAKDFYTVESIGAKGILIRNMFTSGTKQFPAASAETFMTEYTKLVNNTKLDLSPLYRAHVNKCVHHLPSGTQLQLL